MLGNSSIKRAIRSTLEHRPVRPILLEGHHGSGKTTLAHIIAREFGATSEGITHLNCLKTSKVEEARKLLDDLKVGSLFSSKKVLILDEIYGLSKKAQQLFLIPLEDENLNDSTLYISCTTSTDGVDDMLLSRFIRLKVSPLSEEDGVRLLNYVCEKEDIDIPKWLKSLVLDHSNGIPRRLLTGLAVVRNGVKDEDEANFLLEIDSSETDGDTLLLFKIILSAEWEDVRKTLNTLLKSKSPDEIRTGLMSISGGRIMSSFQTTENVTECLAESIVELGNVVGYPEKALLVAGIYNMWRRICKN